LPATEPTEAFWPGAPDLAVEVLSPGDTTGEVSEKVGAWLAAGCTAVWVVDPKLQTVTIYQSPTNVRIFAAGDALMGDPVIPEFCCAVDEIFR
jgi:Uma2 family endonuclease